MELVMAYIYIWLGALISSENNGLEKGVITRIIGIN